MNTKYIAHTVRLALRANENTHDTRSTNRNSMSAEPTLSRFHLKQRYVTDFIISDMSVQIHTPASGIDENGISGATNTAA